MILVDTNVLIYAVNADDPKHKAAKAFLEKLLSGREIWCVSWANLYEFLRATTHPGYMPKPLSAAQAMETVLLLTRHHAVRILTETERHGQALEAVLKEAGPVRGNFFHDCHLAALMMENGVSRVATEDAEFRKFRFLQVVSL